MVSEYLGQCIFALLNARSQALMPSRSLTHPPPSLQSTEFNNTCYKVFSKFNNYIPCHLIISLLKLIVLCLYWLCKLVSCIKLDFLKLHTPWLLATFCSMLVSAVEVKYRHFSWIGVSYIYIRFPEKESKVKLESYIFWHQRNVM